MVPRMSLYLSLKFLHPGLGSFKGVCIGYVINYDGGLSSSETKSKGYDHVITVRDSDKRDGS
jgi:hypothetical protein